MEIQCVHMDSKTTYMPISWCFTHRIIFRWKHDNMNHMRLLKGLFLKEYFLKYILKSLPKILQIFLKKIFILFVKVYAKCFKIYVIFKGFEICL